ncbi:MAG TPA: hypothetical protein DCY12_07800 [Candidatus Atribacteria bacterium]|nr:hypothetical protein [Candidatus Atribacteria bacterium]HCU22095.1 hypothetical protein [Candidatus Atribacteria bacterium]
MEDTITNWNASFSAIFQPIERQAGFKNQLLKRNCNDFGVHSHFTGFIHPRPYLGIIESTNY